ncbi:MAG: hypothetical protein A2Y33_10965 [Spirochaetes bacterium GWF1_51_8]|nr:MAG: hypothetical protein A2Y33_10965 [Spirochaetes bacterium GWF1_51_8]
MTLRQKLVVNLLDKLYWAWKRVFSNDLKEKIYTYICRVFEEEAVACYMFDLKDIGFFEMMILGSDETKKMSQETNQVMEKIKRTELKERLVGYIPSKHIRQRQESEVVWENIEAKKKRVVEVLTEKGELIKYLGRRIVSHNERLYQTIERVYSRLEFDLKKIKVD